MKEKDLVNSNFDFEQRILGCWNVTTDLRDLVTDYADGKLTADQVLQLIDSYSIVYENRFEKTWDLYESVCRGLHELRQQNKDLALTDLPKNSKSKKNSKKVDQ